MNVKLDTKEKFTVLTPEENEITANMAEEVRILLLSLLKKPIPHVVLNMANVSKLSDECAVLLPDIYEQFMQKNASLVICALHPPVQQQLEKLEMLDLLNITPTESEAWDIVQMEEIERELLNNDEITD